MFSHAYARACMLCSMNECISYLKSCASHLLAELLTARRTQDRCPGSAMLPARFCALTCHPLQPMCCSWPPTAADVLQSASQALLRGRCRCRRPASQALLRGRSGALCHGAPAQHSSMQRPRPAARRLRACGLAARAICRPWPLDGSVSACGGLAARVICRPWPLRMPSSLNSNIQKPTRVSFENKLMSFHFRCIPLFF